MSTTETRPLPTDWQTLRLYMPPEPPSTVSRCLEAIARIDRVIDQTKEAITLRDEADHKIVSDVVNASMGDGNLAPVAARINLGDRPQLEFKLQQLRVARSLAAHRHGQAQSHDGTYLAWKRECDQVAEEWRQAMAVHDGDKDYDAARFERLVAFAAAH